MKAKKINVSSRDKIFYFINDLFLLIALIVVLYPIIYIISSSFSSPNAVSTGKVVLFPMDFSLEGYKAVFQHDGILTGYANTIFYTLAGTSVNLIMTVLAAYPLSRKDLKGRKVITFLFTFTMIFSGGLIPSYLLNSNLSLINTRWVMFLPTAINIFNFTIAKNFFENNVPEELYEASQLDGCNYFRFITGVVLPLSKSILAVLALYYAVVHWNSYFEAFLYLTDESKFPLQIFLREILILNSTENMDPSALAARQGLADLLKYSLIVVSSVPLMVVYPFVAKHFNKGALTGAVKG